jgi:hypothetical protein
MAKKQIKKYVFEPGISKDDNLYPNAVALLAANKAFLQAQVVAFINAQIVANTAPFAGYTYASQKCTRDVGFFIDAVLHDLRYGGNVKSRQVADYFWIDGEPMIRGDVSPEIAGQTYLRDLINNYIFTNTTVSPTYGQTAVAQVKIIGSNGEVGAAARNTTLWNVFSSVISGGITAMPAKIPGVSSIRMIGHYDISELLLITDTNNGNILYNFADPSNSATIELKQGRSSGNGELLSDVDFAKWWQVDDAITNIYLSADTSSLESTDKIQIFVEQEAQTIRPWDFGTDAIERMRVSTPQAMLDADFEYGLQPTKWQAVGQIRSYPSLYEVPGTDLSVLAMTTDASVSTLGFGASLITVTTAAPHGYSFGQPITVKNVLNTVTGFARAEGSFLVYSTPGSNVFTYYAASKVGLTNGQSIFNTSVQIRQANYYTGSAIGNPTFSIFSNGASSTISSQFVTSSGSDRIAFVGTAPVPGSPITGPAALAIGTSVAGATGTTTVTTTVATSALGTDTSIELTDVTGIQQGMALEGAGGAAIYITTLAGNILNLSGQLGTARIGTNGSVAGVSGTNVESIGTSAIWDVSYVPGEGGAPGNYTVTDPQDSTQNGTNYSAGDQIKITGDQVGGNPGTNDITITINTVDSGGAITAFIYEGTAASGSGSFSGLSGTNVSQTGASGVFTVTRTAGTYTAVATTGGTGYRAGNKIVIAGTSLNGTSPLNDCTLTVVGVTVGGIISTVTADGITATGESVIIYPVITLSDATIDSIPTSTLLNIGAIATCQIDFTSAHGIIPGTTMFNYITSSPTPSFASTARTLASSATWTGIAFDTVNNNFVAVANGSGNTVRSVNGVDWGSSGNLPSAAAWTSIAFGLVGTTPTLVAVSSGGTAGAYSLNGGTSWTSFTLPSSGTWTSVTFFGGFFVAVRSGSNAGAYSTDGISWAASTLPSSTTWEDVAGGLVGTSAFFVAVASGGTAAAYSADGGVTWLATGALPTSAAWRSVTYGNNRFLAVARASTAAAYSENGVSWISVTLPTSANWNNAIYGEDQFIIIADGGTQALTSPNGTTGSYTDRTLASSATWEEIAYGAIPGNPIFAVVGNGTNALSVVLTSANHQLAAGPFVITEVPRPTTLRYPARSTGFIDTTVPLAGQVFVRPDSFFVHRPFDGGVQLGTGGPSHGAQAIRQSKKYIRYQSGKGMMYTTGALFAPSYNLASGTATATAINSLITFTTDDTDHGLQPGAIVETIGFVSFEYNGTFTVESIVDSRSFRVRTAVVLSSTTATLGADCKMLLKNWHGSTVRIGAFDEQNGIFYQYDGSEMALVKRSSTNQLSGTVSAAPESNTITGTGSRFQDQLFVGDKIVLRGMSHTVTSIASQTSMTVAPDWRGATAISGAKLCKTEDLIIPQADWNLDTLDGNGPSGYELVPNRMQMIGMQYTWYAAGFIEFMLRGADGRFIFLHRIRNSNVNTEAYMRTANLPVRYEVENVSAKSRLKTGISAVDTSLTLVDASRFPTSGIVYVDNEMISYSGKTGNTLNSLTRSASMTNFANGLNRTYFAGAASTHSTDAAVILISVTASPTISHWGSALLTDGLFDNDRGYIFSYAATALSLSSAKQTAFMIRLAPSVSNAIVGDLGERDLLNRAQLLLSQIAITIDTTASPGGVVIEGVLNPRNYPSNPASISWNSLSSSGAGGQPSFAQIALGGSINWGGVAPTTATATVQGALTTTASARAFGSTTQAITARSVGSVGDTYYNAISTNRSDFLITNADYDAIVATPLGIGDTLSATGGGNPINSGQRISSITRNFITIGVTGYTRIGMTASGTNSSSGGSNVTVTVTNNIATTFNRAFSTVRSEFLVTDSDATTAGFAVGDTVSASGFVTAGQTIQTISTTFARIGGVNYTRITLSANANGTSAAATNISTTFQAAGTTASYTGNFLFFTNSTWNSSGATVSTRVATSTTAFPAGTSVASVSTRTLGTTTVRRVTFTQTVITPLASAATVTFQFGDPQFALPGEQVFSFVASPGAAGELDLSQLKELTTTAIGGRGTFPNGPDVLAINVIKVTGTAVPGSIVLRWGEAQA